MYPTQHLILGTLFAIVLFFLFPQITLLGLAIIIVASVLIDVDHYLYYLVKEKDWSLRNAHKWFVMKTRAIRTLPRKERKIHHDVILFLHGFEPLLILYFLMPFSQYFSFVLIGFSFHLFLDILWEIILGVKIQKLSVVYNIYKVKKLFW